MGFYLVVMSEGHFTECADFLWQRLPLWSAGSGTLGLRSSSAHGPWSGASVVVAQGLSCSAECGLFPAQGLNPVNIGCWILDHWTTREVLGRLSVKGQTVCSALQPHGHCGICLSLWTAQKGLGRAVFQ